ncbi:MAG: DUF3021 family protein [Caulobacteraceae bacterium]
MKLADFIKKLVRDYFTIFAVIVICITILRQIFAPNDYLELKDIYIYMICALAGDLPSLILYSRREIPEKEMRLRIILRFVVLEAVLLVLANVTGWVSGILNSVILAVEIAVIYLAARFLFWIDDRKATNSINEKLKAMKDETEGGPEEE